MNEHLYSIGLEHKKTEERIDLQVWAKTPMKLPIN